ncbi:MAG: hypothetical protein A2V74_02055 [Acidobacteria bacterium RBG_16_70_10]|nr:MAG: hypothetical protein A2V74_02055 [Acidobacteria bacterium RBG_16_70_10]
MDVLVYVDPSPRGEWALSVAAQLAAAGTAALHLLATEEDAALDPDLLSRARARLSPGPSVTESVRPGPAERAVVAEASARRPGLVVVPPAGRGAIARMLKGSRVATVVRSVRAPVLVARRPPERIGRVLAALSGRESTARVAAAALDLERDLGVRVAFVHVASEVALPFGAPPGAGEPPSSSEAVRRALRARGREDALVEREGLVIEEVLEEFDRGAFHLLLVGSRGEEAAGFGTEDVTVRLLLRCPGSTLIVPRL